MVNTEEDTGGFASVLRKMLELYEDEGKEEVPIKDLKMLLHHFES